MSELLTRSISAIGIVGCILSATLAGEGLFRALVILIAAGIFYEWTRAALGRNAALVSAILTATFAWALLRGAPLCLILPGVLLLSVAFPLLAVVTAAPGHNLKRDTIASAGLAYAFIALYHLTSLYSAHGCVFILWIWFTLWITDAGAFLVGKTLGGPKLAPRISPSKTWSGLIGGTALAVMVSALIWFGETGSAREALRLAAATGGLSICAHIGDLLESWAKRYFGVKDLGRLLPGHGGLADRFDSLLFVCWGLLLASAVFSSI